MPKHSIKKSCFVWHCLFYFDENYTLTHRKRSKSDLLEHQPKSGAALAYKYAKQKIKEVINVI